MANICGNSIKVVCGGPEWKEIAKAFKEGRIDWPQTYEGIDCNGSNEINFSTKWAPMPLDNGDVCTLSSMYPSVVFEYRVSPEGERKYTSWICNGEELKPAKVKAEMAKAVDKETKRFLITNSKVGEGVSHRVEVMESGKVAADGDNRFGECAVLKWKDVTSISCGNWHTVGLKKDGTLLACGSDTNGQCDVSDFSDIVAVSCGRYHTAALTKSGTIRIASTSGQFTATTKWTGLRSICSVYDSVLGLKTDGTVLVGGATSPVDGDAIKALFGKDVRLPSDFISAAEVERQAKDAADIQLQKDIEKRQSRAKKMEMLEAGDLTCQLTPDGAFPEADKAIRSFVASNGNENVLINVKPKAAINRIEKDFDKYERQVSYSCEQIAQYHRDNGGIFPNPEDRLVIEKSSAIKQLQDFLKVCLLYTQGPCVRSVLEGAARTKGGTLHKGRVLHIASLRITNGYSFYELVAVNEDTHTILIEIRNTNCTGRNYNSVANLPDCSEIIEKWCPGNNSSKPTSIDDRKSSSAVKNEAGLSGGVSIGKPKMINANEQTTTPTKATTIPSISEITSATKVGDIVTFGNYWQMGKQTIAWRVLKVSDGRALLLSDKCLDCMPYDIPDQKPYDNDTAHVIPTWATCTLRTWLNADFLSAAFSVTESARISTTTVTNPNNPTSGTDGGVATNDKVFILSIGEATSYFSTNAARVGRITAYAKARGAFDISGAVLWWLRSPGYFGDCCAAYVDINGSVGEGGEAMYRKTAVRPALWVNLDVISSETKGAMETDSPKQARPETHITSSTSAPVKATTPESTMATIPSNTTIAPTMKVGDKVQFGSYWQKENCELEKEPIAWRVLEVRGGKALLLSDKNLDCKPYNICDYTVIWAKCTLRIWLNSDFLKAAFTKEEASGIAQATILNPDNPTYGTVGGQETIDKVFLLNIEEVNTYYSTRASRISMNTAYAIEQGADDIAGAGWWWLRSPGDYAFDAASVSDDGSVCVSGCSVDHDEIAVRPAIWVNLTSCLNHIQCAAIDATGFGIDECKVLPTISSISPSYSLVVSTLQSPITRLIAILKTIVDIKLDSCDLDS